MCRRYWHIFEKGEIAKKGVFLQRGIKPPGKLYTVLL